jgi:diguanylate cyclase (GGDEF)-like protein
MPDMSSIRSKTTLLTVCEIAIAATIVAIISVFSIQRLGHDTSEQLLWLLCETGERNLDDYFDSVEQSVETVSSYAASDLAQTDLSDLGTHLDRVGDLFKRVAINTPGVLTYYYRVDPEVSTDDIGFWYVYNSREGFLPRTPTDITQYDTSDQDNLVWFTVPKATGKSLWLAPYVTDNLDVYVFSYNVPLYKDGKFVGVIGIEIDYSTVAEVVDSITLFDNGHAFINDAEGNLVYHPTIDVARLQNSKKPGVPEGVLSDDTFVRYTYDGVDKQAVWLPLSNGMRLYVTVPIAEVNRNWQILVNQIAVVSLVLLVVFAVLTRRFVLRITNPLNQLTAAAEELDKGNYDVELSYAGNDEVGKLTQTVQRLLKNLRSHMEKLSSLAYADALTHVHNKGAYQIAVDELQEQLDDAGREEPIAFGVGIFDCDHLKQINDAFGHDKGDVYIKTACSIICAVFDHSPVFRIGGDEFAVLLQNADYENRDALTAEFDERIAAQCASAEGDWERVSVSHGIAVYDPATDDSVSDVARRADKRMYEAKLTRNTTR